MNHFFFHIQTMIEKFALYYYHETATLIQLYVSPSFLIFMSFMVTVMLWIKLIINH